MFNEKPLKTRSKKLTKNSQFNVFSRKKVTSTITTEEEDEIVQQKENEEVDSEKEAKVPIPKNPFRRAIYTIVTSNIMSIVISVVIILNLSKYLQKKKKYNFFVVVMCLQYQNMPEILTNFISIANYTFAAIFVLEMILKMIGLGIYFYFKDPLNRFDFVLVVVAVVEVIINTVSGGTTGLVAFRYNLGKFRTFLSPFFTNNFHF